MFIEAFNSGLPRINSKLSLWILLNSCNILKYFYYDILSWAFDAYDHQFVIFMVSDCLLRLHSLNLAVFQALPMISVTEIHWTSCGSTGQINLLLWKELMMGTLFWIYMGNTSQSVQCALKFLDYQVHYVINNYRKYHSSLKMFNYFDYTGSFVSPEYSISAFVLFLPYSSL